MTLKRIACLLTTVVLLLCACAAFAQEETYQFDVTDYISDLSQLDLAQHRGKVLVLYFCSTTSGDSLSQLTMWNNIANDYDPNGLSIFVILSCDGDGESALERIRKQYGLENVILYADEGDQLCRPLGVDSFPNVLLLDRFGSPSSGYNGLISYETIAEHLDTLGVRKVSK